MQPTNLRRPAAVLFDLDGTLVDTTELIVRCFQHTTSVHLGRAIRREEVIPTIGRRLLDVLEELAPGRGRELIETYRVENRRLHDEVARAFPGVVEALRGLRARGLPLAIVTAKARSTAELSYHLCDATACVDVFVTMDDTDRHKPHPAPLLLAAERLGLPPEVCWYVGDSTHDMEAARAAGMWAVGAGWGPYPRASLEPLAHVIVEQPTDLLRLVDSGTDERP